MYFLFYMLMQTISIFIASSFELSDWREYIGDAIRAWSDEFEPKGFRIKMLCWEDYHPEYTGIRKQDEYNEDLVKESVLFFALFRTRCGDYTKEEIGVAQGYMPDRLWIIKHDTKTATPDIDSYLKTIGITPSVYDDISAAISEIRVRLENYINSQPVTPGVDNNIHKYVYGTVGTDIDMGKVRLSNLVRSVDNLAEAQMGMRCHYYSSDISKLTNTDYFIGILKDSIGPDLEDEITRAIVNTSPALHPNSLVIYINHGDKAIDSHPALKFIVDSNGVFPEPFDNYHRIKFNLVVWLLSKRLLRIDGNAGFGIANGWVTFLGYKLVPAADLKISGMTDDEKIQSLLGLISKKLLCSPQCVSADITKPLDLNRIDADLRKIGHASVLSKQIYDDHISATKDILDVINGRLNNLDWATEPKTEFFGLLLRKVDCENRLLDCNVLDAKTALRSRIKAVNYYDLYQDFLSEFNFDENNEFRQISDIAQRYDISDPTIEMMRMNYANHLARHRRNSEALAQYRLAAYNLERLDNGTPLMIRYLPAIYLNFISHLTGLREYQEARKYLNDFDNKVKVWFNAGKLPLAPIIYRILIAQFKLRLPNKDISRLIVECLHLWNNVLLQPNLEVPENYIDDIFAYFPNSLAAAILDETPDYFSINSVNKRELAVRILFTAEKSILKHVKDRYLRLFHLAQTYHNIAFAMTDENLARKYALKALSLRREMYELTRTPNNRGEIARILLLVGATFINTCNSNLSIADSNAAMGYAQECLEIYQELRDDNFLETVTNIYQAKLLIGTIMHFTDGMKEEGDRLIRECRDWSLAHPDNSYRDTFRNEAIRLLE